MPAIRRFRVLLLALAFMFISFYYLTNNRNTWNYGYTPYLSRLSDQDVRWSQRPDRYPVSSLIPLPTGAPKHDIPKVQAAQPKENAAQKKQTAERRETVKQSFMHSWEGYKNNAWMHDEVTPLTGGWKNTFGGWAATLVDSLDALWILGLTADFEMAVGALEEIDFSTTEAKDINVFETTIRYMGGFLAAYDISGRKYPMLLQKATEVGELLMSCFDTPNRMPISRWDWRYYVRGNPQVAPLKVLVAELGSLSLEFTRLTQLTGDQKYYDAIQRIADEFEKSQSSTRLPGMWPVMVNAQTPSFKEDNSFTLGGMSDSLYEYFPKQYLIMGGLLEQPKTLYENFIGVAKERMFFRFYNPENEPLSLSGDVRINKSGGPILAPRMQHLTCFTGGMVALAAKIFNRPDELKLAEELTAGCVWSYDSSANGIGPEIFTVAPCVDTECKWSDKVWHDQINKHFFYQGEEGAKAAEAATKNAEEVIRLRRLTPGMVSIDDHRYVLRPEAIESVFMMYRITGDRKWQDAAWRMFQHVDKASRTKIAAGAIQDMTVPPETIADQQTDSMESFWLAETLKYFYLCFTDFETVSLDEYVLNTEAHPLRRPG